MECTGSWTLQFSSVAQSCPTLWDPMDYSTPGFPVHHQLSELTKFMSIQSVMPSNHLILCHPPPLLPSIFPSIRVFSNESDLLTRWPKYWSFSFSISPSSEYSGLIPLGWTGFSFWKSNRLLRVPWTIRKEIQPVHPKGNQSWIFTGRTDAKAEAPILWPPDAKSWLTGKDPDAGKDWRQEEKGVAEDDPRASPTQWIWVWASSGRWWRTGKPDTWQSKGSQRVRHDLATEQQQWLSLCLQDKLLLLKQLKLKQTYMA